MSSNAPAPRDPNQCLRCNGQLKSLGVEHFRVGGVSGGWGMVFGEMAEVGEGLLDFEVLACQSCRKVELRVPER